MQESIFYNKEQLKIIRNYGFLHLTLFKFGVAILAGLASIGVSFWMISSGYFSSIYLLEKKDDSTVSQAQMTYTNKQQQVASIPGLQGILLNGNINITEGSIIAQEALLTKGGITLPRKTNISTAALDYYIQGQTKERFSDDYMNGFFQTMLVNPASDDATNNNPHLFALGGTIKDIFGLECTTTKSRNSFVCTSYIKNFLNRFYYYDLSTSTSEISVYFSALSNNTNYKKGICLGLLMNGNFVTSIDSNLSDLFRSCGSDDYNKFILLRDFLSLNKQFSVGYVDTIAYNSQVLNEYKLFSLQQLLYKEISAAADVESLIQSYINFLREVLIKEENREDALLSTFSKSFAYWFNMNVLSPYFKDETSKMDKESRTSLYNEMLTINYGDTISGFKGLQEQSLYQTDSTTGSKQPNIVYEKIPIRELFIQSYLPANFNLYSVDTGDNEDTLIVKGVDLKTNYEIKAKLRYENLQLGVVNIDISTEKNRINTTLSEFINASIGASKNSTSLNQTLALIYEYKDFASKPLETYNLCDQIETDFQGHVDYCDPNIIKLSSNDIGIPVDETVIYTFYVASGALTGVEVSNELLADQISASLDLSNVDAASTLLMIKNIMAYKLEDNDTGFGLKEYLAISEIINKFLGDDTIIEPENGAITVNFRAGGITFIGNYDTLRRELNPIAISFTTRSPIIVQGLSLTLKDENLEEIKKFLDDPISKLEELNPALVERYFGDRIKKEEENK